MASTHQPDVTAALQRASELLRAGQTSDAGAVLDRLLAAVPDQPDALQLRGLVARREGQQPAAERWLRQSLAAAPNQPHVLNNLANLLRETGRLDEAIACYREAVRQRPDYADAWTNLGLSLSSAARHEPALAAVEQALKVAPASGRALLGKAACLRALDRFDAAERTLRTAVQAAPNDLKAMNNLANLLRERGEERAAAALYEQALQRAPAAHPLRVGLAGAYYNDGQAAAAEQALAQVLAADPTQLDAHHTLTTILSSTGRTAEVATAYEAALARAPDHRGLWEAYLGATWLLEDYQAGLALVERALAACGAHPVFDLWRGRFLLSDGQAEAALAWLDLRRDAATGPGHGVAIERARAHLALGAYADGAAELAPIAFAAADDYGLWAHLEVLWRLAEEDRAAWLLDYDRFVQAVEVPVPAGYDRADAFYRDLAQLLTGLHVSRTHPHDQTLRHGTQTYGRLFNRREPLLGALKQAITQAVAGFAAGLPDDPTHPFLKHKGAALRFSGSWSVLLFDAGFHVPHYHSEGWISSAYYVALPDPVADPATPAGRLEFGRPPLPVPHGGEPVMQIQPRPGLLALFPSYCWHGTVPFQADQPRLTVAFDMARHDPRGGPMG
ncbi:MAG: tetratricopeptide repeat protein [Rhodothalassiaceae bacterium]